MASTYTQTDGDSSGNVYFQDVAISPASLKDGSLLQRFDTKVYPSKGIISNPAAGATAVVASASTLTPVGGASVTFTATVTGNVGRIPTGTVQFKDGVTNLGAAQAVNASGVATLVLAGGVATGAHTITAVYSGDSKNPGKTSAAITVTAS